MYITNTTITVTTSKLNNTTKIIQTQQALLLIGKIKQLKMVLTQQAH